MTAKTKTIKNTKFSPTDSSEAETRADPRLCNELDRRFKDEKVPLTRHMVLTWHRFDKRQQFHIQTNASRFDFCVWYVWEYLSQKSYLLPPLPHSIISVLSEPVGCYESLPKFLFAVWKKYYEGNPRYNVFTEHGYYRFLIEVGYFEARTRGAPRELTGAEVVSRLNAPQPGYAGDFFLTRGLYQRWADSPVYQSKYPNLHDINTLQTFIFDQILLLAIRDEAEELFPTELLNWWRAPIHEDLPRMSRFLFELARQSRTFAEDLRRGWVDAALAQRIVSWFDSDVLPEWPAMASLVPQSARPAPTGDALPKWGRETLRLQRAVTKPLAIISKSEMIDVLVIGPYSAPTGLGSGVRRSVGALERAGVNYRVADFFFDSPSRPAPGANPRPYAGEQARINLWHFNAEYIADVIAATPEIKKGRRNIGYFFWETETLPTCHELGQDIVDEIWAPSQFCADIYSSAPVPVVNVGTSVELPDVGGFFDRSHFGFAENEVVFMFSFDSHSVIHRKNPAAVLRAFLKAFGKTDYPVRLVIKTQNMLTAHWSKINGRGEEMLELCREDSRITLYDKTMTLKELYSLKNCSDCYISLHRSEGFGYGPAEAMALGKPVIMTDYSANTEFGNASNALMVPSKLIQVMPDEYLYWTSGMIWADPDVDIAAEFMLRVYQDPMLRARLGRAAQESIVRDFGVEAMAKRYSARLAELGIACGQRVTTDQSAA